MKRASNSDRRRTSGTLTISGPRLVVSPMTRFIFTTLPAGSSCASTNPAGTVRL